MTEQEQYIFEADCDMGGSFVVGMRETGEVVFRWYGGEQEVQAKLDEFLAMSRPQQAVLVLEVKAQEIVRKANERIADIQAEAARNIAKKVREAELNMDAMLDHAFEEDRELRDYFISNNLTLVAGKRVKELGKV